ncbi:hypothetical protein HYT84_01875 [Candidatus Micrarchaeota archaeon]|nr:hypothetical protein [Candidatus Micrarchaeota archaeon]
MGPPINKREEVWKPFQEQFEKDLPWLRDFLGPNRREFYQGLVKVIVEYRNFPSRTFYKLLKANKRFMEETSAAIKDKIGETRFAPPITKGKSREELMYEVNKTIASAVIVGNLLRIDPKFIIVIAGYETKFQNKMGANGTGVCQLTANSSFNELKNNRVLAKANEVLANLGGAEIMYHKISREELMNIFLNVLEAGKTMVLKMVRGKVNWENIEDGSLEYRKLAYHYNGNTEIGNDGKQIRETYAYKVYEQYKKFYGVKTEARYREDQLRDLSKLVPKLKVQD